MEDIRTKNGICRDDDVQNEYIKLSILTTWTRLFTGDVWIDDRHGRMNLGHQIPGHKTIDFKHSIQETKSHNKMSETTKVKTMHKIHQATTTAPVNIAVLSLLSLLQGLADWWL